MQVKDSLLYGVGQFLLSERFAGLLGETLALIVFVCLNVVRITRWGRQGAKTDSMRDVITAGGLRGAHSLILHCCISCWTTDRLPGLYIRHYRLFVHLISTGCG